METLVSIIICTKDRFRSLCRMIDSIEQCEVPQGLCAELIIVDNGSSDATAETVRVMQHRRIPVRYVSEPRKGKGHAYNAGIAAARGECLLFTDDDLLVPGNWIAGMSRQLLRGEADAVQGGVRVAPHLSRRWLLEGFPCIGASTQGMTGSAPDFLIGANMAISRRVLERVPAFDPELGPGALGFGEETLYAWQLRRAGYRIGSEFDVVAEHHFDENRLAPAAITETCRKNGRVKAYLAYHWEHSDLWGFDWAGCFRRTLAFSWKRLARGSEWSDGNPPSYWRLPLEEAVAFVTQYRRERKRQRNYARHGLVRQAQA